VQRGVSIRVVSEPFVEPTSANVAIRSAKRYRRETLKRCPTAGTTLRVFVAFPPEGDRPLEPSRLRDEAARSVGDQPRRHAAVR